jgi:hypothetical protein
VAAGSVVKARWLRDLLRFLPLRSQFVLSGNTRDLQIHEAAPGQITSVSLARALPDAFKEVGYGRIASFDLLNGFRALEPSDDSFLTHLGLTPANGTAAGGIDLLASSLERHVPSDGPPSALIIDFASRLIARSEALTPAEHQLFSRALILSHSARARPAGERRQPFFNAVIWIVDKEGDLPDWFLIGKRPNQWTKKSFGGKLASLFARLSNGHPNGARRTRAVNKHHKVRVARGRHFRTGVSLARLKAALDRQGPLTRNYRLSPLFLPNVHSIPPSSRCKPVVCWPMRFSRRGCQGTS